MPAPAIAGVIWRSCGSSHNRAEERAENGLHHNVGLQASLSGSAFGRSGAVAPIRFTARRQGGARATQAKRCGRARAGLRMTEFAESLHKKLLG
jgi:hypothetical protein